MGCRERFWGKALVGDPGDCWEWNAARTGPGYGAFWLSGRTQLAHRVAYELEVREIPEGLDIDHLCRNRGCVNPAHMEPVTRGENVLRGVGFTAENAKKTHCPSGHPYDSDNTYINGSGHRVCRECNRQRGRVA